MTSVSPPPALATKSLRRREPSKLARAPTSFDVIPGAVHTRGGEHAVGQRPHINRLADITQPRSILEIDGKRVTSPEPAGAPLATTARTRTITRRAAETAPDELKPQSPLPASRGLGLEVARVG